MDPDLADHIRRVIDANRYMALGTVEEVGDPWVSPVWFASEDYHTFHWVSSRDAKHSRNLAFHPEVAIAIFDSSVPIGGGQAVYMRGETEQPLGADLGRGLEVFDSVSQREIGRGGNWPRCKDRRSSGCIGPRSQSIWVLIAGGDPKRGSGVDRSERVSLA